MKFSCGDLAVEETNFAFQVQWYQMCDAAIKLPDSMRVKKLWLMISANEEQRQNFMK